MPKSLTTSLIEDEMPALIEGLKCQRGRRQWAHYFVWFFLSCTVLALFVSIAQASLAPVGIALFTLLINALVLQLYSNEEMSTLRRIGEYHDVRSIPVLMDTFFENEFPDRMYIPVLSALNKILPQVTPSDSEAFTPNHRELLHSLFLRYHDQKLNTSLIAKNHAYYRLQIEISEKLCYSLRLGALHALVQVGNEETARALKRFLQQRYRSDTQVRLQQLALTSLFELEKRLEREKDAKTLLRASSYTEDLLLRPSYAQPTEPTETLLRPAQSHAESED